MENAVEALKMAFAVFVFVLAVTLGITMFTQAKMAADAIINTEDETSYYDYYRLKDDNGAALYEERIVGLESVIPTLYKYSKENYTVVFKEGIYQENTGNIVSERYMTIYDSSIEPKYWATGDDGNGNQIIKYDWTKYGKSELQRAQICSFDIIEESQRREPWIGTQAEIIENLNCFLGGKTYNGTGIYKNKSNNGVDISYGDGFIKKLKSKVGKDNPQFVERIGEYGYKQSDETQLTINGETINLLKQNKKRVITYVLLTNM